MSGRLPVGRPVVRAGLRVAVASTRASNGENDVAAN